MKVTKSTSEKFWSTAITFSTAYPEEEVDFSIAFPDNDAKLKKKKFITTVLKEENRPQKAVESFN